MHHFLTIYNFSNLIGVGVSKTKDPYYQTWGIIYQIEDHEKKIVYFYDFCVVKHKNLQIHGFRLLLRKHL